MEFAEIKEFAKQKRKERRMKIEKIKEFARQHNCLRQDENGTMS